MIFHYRPKGGETVEFVFQWPYKHRPVRVVWVNLQSFNFNATDLNKGRINTYHKLFFKRLDIYQ